ncbi:coiled-coil domain-containing protein [Brevibacillus migulae]|uniref:hypothetical protein n=1 Tax=Brevibacillus migulae TaxID=1644114 RepID=UPI00106DD985|nr:hypothetical protein [Brevibacillus migulae]
MLPQRHDQLHVLLETIRKKLFVQQWLWICGRFLLAGGWVAAFLLLLARFAPVTRFRLEVTLVILVLSLFASLVYAWRKAPTLRTAASFADQHGLEQRVSTTLDHLNNDSPIAQLQREDTLDRLQRALPHLLAEIKMTDLPRKQWWGLLGTAVVCLTLLLIPNPMDEKLRIEALQTQEAEKLEEKLEQMQEDLKSNQQLTDEQRGELKELVQQLQKELKSLEAAMDKAQALEKTNMLLKQLQEKQNQSLQALQAIQQMLANQVQTQALGKALEQKDAASLQTALQEWQKQLEALPLEKQKELAEEWKRTAESIAKQAGVDEQDNQQMNELAGNLKKTAEALQNGQLGDSTQQMAAAMSQAMQQLQNNQAYSASLEQAVATIQQSQMMMAAAAGQATSGATAASGAAQAGSTPSGALSPGGGSQSAPSGNNASIPAGGSQAGGGSTGQGAGTGTGVGAGSANQGGGNGSGQGTGGSGGNGSGPGGRGAGLGSGNHELVAVPSERLQGTGGPMKTVGGPLGQGASEMRDSNQTQVTSGSVRPYAEVYKQYEQMSRQTIERSDIPDDYKEMVRDYFQGIEP